MSHRPPAIRQAALADLDTLIALNAGIQAHHADLYPDFFAPRPDPASTADLFRRVLADPASRVWIAQTQGSAAGYLWAEWLDAHQGRFSRMPQRLLIHHIGVAKGHRRCGIARRLMDEARVFAGNAALELTSWADNRGAHAFFAAMGFAPLRTVFFHPGEDPSDGRKS